MANTLIPGRLEAQFEKTAKKKAKIMREEDKLYAKFDNCCSDQMIREAFESISKMGKPKHQKQAEELKQKYDDGSFGFSDAFALNNLYKAVGKNATNKENDDD